MDFIQKKLKKKQWILIIFYMTQINLILAKNSIEWAEIE